MMLIFIPRGPKWHHYQSDPLTQAAMFSCLCQILTEPSECQEKPRSIRPDVFRIFSFDGPCDPFPVLSWQQWLHVHRCSSPSAAPGFRLLCVNYRDPEVNSLWSSHASPSAETTTTFRITSALRDYHTICIYAAEQVYLTQQSVSDCIWSVFNP